MTSDNSPSLADLMNRDCYCLSVDRNRLQQELDCAPEFRPLFRQLLETHPHLFAEVTVFVSAEQRRQMQALITAIERVIALPAWQGRVLGEAAVISRRPTATRGVFMGYDFHVTEDGPKLIEVNTNAGGAWLNLILRKAQQACCEVMNPLLPPGESHAELQDALVRMFEQEWRLESGEDRPLQTLAIIDENPESQYLYPEFLLARCLLESRGYRVIIADPAMLAYRDGALWHETDRLDLVYNRLTDFDLSTPASAALREAWLADAVVLTPNPRHHTLYAHKANLTLLGDADWLRRHEVSEDDIATLQQGIPTTRRITPDNAEMLWSQRKDLFFKPVAGYGGKAAYRGDKITKRVWEEIQAGDYVAQTRIPPSERMVLQKGEQVLLKFDLRCYTYAGKIQLMAARLYQGQTTNFRTPGGGFAPVFVFP
jgi:glutathione synthase/RimK-type ligase-like ATP-grasp enzyme